MSIEEIPPNQMMIMNEYWHRAFNAAGCDPSCHCCNKMILVGMSFHLGTVALVHPMEETTEVMLCASCTVDGYNKKLAELKEYYASQRTGGCYRVAGKIMTTLR